METNYKQILDDIDDIKDRIADLAKEQKNLKPQRKTVHFKGERTIDPSEATYKVDNNKSELRYLYAAYGLLRGKGFEITESSFKPLDADEYYQKTGKSLDKQLCGKHPLMALLSNIDLILQQYGYEIPKKEITKKFYWSKELKKIKVYDIDNYEKIVCVGE